MITLKRVTKLFDTVKAVADVSLEVAPACSVVLVGPSGSGKTTLLRLIAGLEALDGGEIYIGGRLASKNGYVLEPHKRNLGFVFQTPALWPHMTVAQNILFGLNSISKAEARSRLHELLTAASLNGLESRYPHQLSGGEARRVSVIRTLAPKPKYLLMDEPLSSVDPDLKTTMLSLIKGELCSTGASLLYVTHDSEEARNVSGRVLRLRNGSLEGATY